MGNKCRGLIMPSENPRIQPFFETIKPTKPMYLKRVSSSALGVGFSYMNGSVEDYEKIGCAFSRVAGSAMFCWRHSSNADGFTLFEGGSIIEKFYDEYWHLNKSPTRECGFVS